MMGRAAAAAACAAACGAAAAAVWGGAAGVCAGLVAVLNGWMYGLFARPSSLDGLVVLVTGGAGGVGAEMAVLFAREGCAVAVWDVAGEEAMRGTAARVAREAPGAPAVVWDRVDVSERGEVVAAAARLGRVDVLVNNAGVACGGGAGLLEVRDDEIERALRTNTLAHFWTARAFLPGMVARGRGHVVTVASVAGFQGVAYLAPYAVSKFGAWGFADCLRHEVRATGCRGVRTSAVFPYLIRDTPMFERVDEPWAAPLVTGPPLRAADVARETVDAVRYGRESVVLPRHLVLLHLMRLLPVWVSDGLSRWIGAADAGRSLGRATTAR